MAREPSGNHPRESYPGEPGVGLDLQPPFVAEEPATRWLFSLNRFGIRPGLRRIRSLLADLGHPERDVPSLVVAGTNGKGSTTRMLAQLLRSAGYRVGCFTSPHLLRVYERLTINDRPCDPARFASGVWRLRPLVEQCQASWFETLTALALDICREEGVDFLCCEAGLGGRLDATNALPAKAILLTTVSRDHCHILGESLAEIAAEKLGLLKPDVPLFSAVGGELRSQVFTTAVRAGCRCHFLDELVRWQPFDAGWQLSTRRGTIDDLPRWEAPVLQRNAALALLCLEELAAAGEVRPIPNPAEALSELFLPGRFQQVLHSPDWIFDTAHNSEAILASLDAFLVRPCRGRRLVLFGAMHNKELQPAVGERLRACDTIVAAPVQLPRSRNPAELRALLEEWQLWPGGHHLVASGLQVAIAHLAGMCEPEDAVLVLGSCFLVAETLYRLGWRDIEQTRQGRPAAKVLAPFGFPDSSRR